MSAIVWWVRRDFRLTDNAALDYASRSGTPVLPLYIDDDGELFIHTYHTYTANTVKSKQTVN